MPLQQINVTPIENKETESSFKEAQMYIRSSKSQEVYGRSESQSSSQTSTSVEICRICHCEGDTEGGLIAPCYCSGSLRYVHQNCLQQWIKSSNIRCCELCKFQFIMHTKTKPFMEWEPLEMTGFERRKLLCAVIFHAIAITCVVWSLYVLINRTAEEIHEGVLEWPFWTKLIVVAIGFTGGVVFMYIQCKAYMQICQRWKAFNRVIYVQNAPEKQPLPLQVPAASESSTSGCQLTKSRQSMENNGNFKDETSIDLKGVRNLHIFFNDESRVCVQNEDRESEESEGGQDTSWRIKIGKAESVPSQRCNEIESKIQGDAGESEDCCIPSSSKSTEIGGVSSSKPNNDSVLKLQIKKAEIVIKFGETGNGNSEDNRNCSGDRQDRHQDTSVNIKIDDKEREPIVIDVVKKKQPAIAEAPKDPVQIRFDFGNEEEKCSTDADQSDCKLLQVYTAESESDSGSHSPLLSNKHNSSYADNI